MKPIRSAAAALHSCQLSLPSVPSSASGRAMACRAASSLLLLSLALPALAQTPVGRWSVTYTYNGTSTSQKNGVGTPVPWPPNGPLPVPIQSFAANDHLQVQMSGTITATLRWVDSNGNPLTDPPPPRDVYLLQRASAKWLYALEEGSVHLDSHAASDGLGDPEVMQGTSGESAGRRLLRVDGSSGTVTLPLTLSARLELTCTSGYGGSAQATVTYGVLVVAPADDYQFTGYPSPPPVGTTPYGQTAADYQDGPLADGSGYYVSGRVYTNQTAHHALGQLRETAVFFVFGHGGSAFQSCQTFWSNNQWGAIVQTTGGRDRLVQQGMPAANIVVLDNEQADAFNKVLLAVYEGCYTGYYTATWGSPVRGTVNKGARCAVGFNTPIYSNAFTVDGQGAEAWCTWFWDQLYNQGKTVAYTRSIVAQYFTQGSGLRSMVVEGRDSTPGNFTIHPARYGNQ